MDNGVKPNILIVDDITINIRVLLSILQPEYSCIVAKSGAEAIDAAQELLPDIILLDIVMPDMNGYAVLSALKDSEMTRRIPVIFLTGLENPEDEEKGLSLGAADYIHRSLSPSIIKLRVKNQLQIAQQIRTIENLNRELTAALKALEGTGYAKLSLLTEKREVSPAVLQAFLRDATRIEDVLETLLKKQDWGQKDRDLFIIELHGVKSALSNIGRKTQSDEAGKLEQAGRDGDRFTIRDKAPQFLKSLRAVIDDIAPKEKVDQGVEDARVLFEGLRLIQDACTNYNKRVARTTLEQLSRARWCKKTRTFLGKLSGNMLHSEFEEAAKSINNFMQESTDNLRLKMDIIQNACEAYDPDAVHEALDQLKYLTLPINTRNALSEIDRLILLGDYEEAARTANKAV